MAGDAPRSSDAQARKARHAARWIDPLEPRTLLSVTVFQDDFEGAFPGDWVVGNNGGITTAKWGDNDAAAYDGNWSAFCADNGNNERTTYDNNLSTYMQRSGVSLDGDINATLSFEMWLKTEANYDEFSVWVCDGSGNWSKVFSASGNQSASGWQSESIDLSAYAGQTWLAISFDFDSDSSAVPSGAAGAWIDDVALTATTALPDLTPAAQSGWGDAVVLSPAIGDYSDTATLYDNQPLYASWSVTNDGGVAASTRFDTQLLIDGNYAGQWYSDSLDPDGFASTTDTPIGKLSAGTHTISIIADINNTITEADESNNRYDKTITVQAGVPGGQLSDASELGAITAQPIDISSSLASGDVQMYSFEVTAGQSVSFNINHPAHGLPDSWLRLFDSSGNELAYNDDAAAPGESPSYDSYLEYTFDSADTYTIAVSGYANNGYDPINGSGTVSSASGAYHLIVSDISLPADADNTLATAQDLGTVTQAITTSDTLYDGGDVDMFAIEVSAGQEVDFNINSAGAAPLSDSWIRVFDANGNELAFNDDGAAPGEPASYDSYLAYTFASAGTYYLGVSGYRNSDYDAVTGDNTTSGAAGTYDLVLITPVVAQDPNDRISTAADLGDMSQPRQVTDELAAGAAFGPDVNIYAFEVTAGQTISFNIDKCGANPLSDSWIRLFDANGTELAYNDDGTGPAETPSYDSYMTYAFTTSGTYYLGVSGYHNSGYDPITGDGDVAGATGQYTLTIAPLADDWFSQNLQDATIAATARNLYNDGSLSREDMIAIFRSAEADGAISSNELHDFRVLVANGGSLGMSQDVQVLADHVVNANSANAQFQGQALGNLYGGSSADQLEKLIGKWFLGTDRPAIPDDATYAQAAGSLFINGPGYSDVRQGSLGDCYFLSALGETAAQSGRHYRHVHRQWRRHVRRAVLQQRAAGIRHRGRATAGGRRWKPDLLRLSLPGQQQHQRTVGAAGGEGLCPAQRRRLDGAGWDQFVPGHRRRLAVGCDAANHRRDDYAPVVAFACQRHQRAGGSERRGQRVQRREVHHVGHGEHPDYRHRRRARICAGLLQPDDADLHDLQPVGNRQSVGEPVPRPTAVDGRAVRGRFRAVGFGLSSPAQRNGGADIPVCHRVCEWRHSCLPSTRELPESNGGS